MKEDGNTMKIAITGGKGGTGKSTLSTSLALELSHSNKVMLVDADVECPDDHIILSTTRERIADVESLIPVFNQDKCSKCGNCSEVCRENAIVSVKDRYPFVISGQCNGCGACLLVCPSGAIREGKQVVGAVYKGKCQQNISSENLLLIWGEIEVGCENTSLVVKSTKDHALSIASGKSSYKSQLQSTNSNNSSSEDTWNSPYEYILIDTAAGTHCNVINALIGVDLALAVTEPTPLGKHDLELILSLLKIMETPVQIVVNKADMGDLNLIHQLSQGSNFPIIQEIPYEKDIMKKHSRNQPVTHDSLKKLADSISNLSIVGGEE